MRAKKKYTQLLKIRSHVSIWDVYREKCTTHLLNIDCGACLWNDDVERRWRKKQKHTHTPRHSKIFVHITCSYIII